MLTADTVEPDAADAGDWRMRAASDVTADTHTPKHAARCNGCPVSVSGYSCSCSMAEPRLGLGRGGVILTPSAILLTKRLDVSCMVCLNAINHVQKNIAHANDGGGGHGPPPPWIRPCWMPNLLLTNIKAWHGMSYAYIVAAKTPQTCEVLFSPKLVTV